MYWEDATEDEVLAIIPYVWFNPYISGNWGFFEYVEDIYDLLKKIDTPWGRRLFKMVYNDYIMGREIKSLDLDGVEPIKNFEQLLGLEEVPDEAKYTGPETLEEYCEKWDAIYAEEFGQALAEKQSEE